MIGGLWFHIVFLRNIESGRRILITLIQLRGTSIIVRFYHNIVVTFREETQSFLSSLILHCLPQSPRILSVLLHFLNNLFS